MLNPARAQKVNKDIVSDYFAKVKALLQKLMIDRPQCIYNMDEKGCRISLHYQQTLVAMKGSKRVHQIVNEHGESVTVVGCMYAISAGIPPMILFKGKELKSEFNNDNLPVGSLVKMTPKGYTTHSTFVDFIGYF
ncbi:hypothetical protein ILUMI_01535 [Ignelater luminosus]|uniref:Uncharacterized protein n=1 Tax=Ignelater luminosus TaxID=2038154 RepID=A0A8K0GM59_IGNLU|nr:hypothetical protein ILUMI_01535 [Ignelater luminosus]